MTSSGSGRALVPAWLPLLCWPVLVAVALGAAAVGGAAAVVGVVAAVAVGVLLGVLASGTDGSGVGAPREFGRRH